MKLVRAQDSDSDNLTQYFLNTNLSGRINLKIVRKNNFFLHYKIQSDDFCTYVLLDEKNQNKIQATVTMVFKEARIAGELRKVAFATDLRVSPERNVILKWSQLMLPTLKKESQDRNCKYVFSVVNEWHSQANNAFIRPRTIRRELPRYYLFRRFEAICIHGRWPFAPDPLASISVRFARESDLESLAQYVSQKTKNKPLSFNFTPELFNINLNRWQHLKISDFLLALDANEDIIGCVALWNPSYTQDFIATSFDTKVSTMREALQFLSLFGLARKFSDQGEKLNFVTLSYFLANNADIFHALLNKAFDSITDNHFLIYPHFEGNLLTQPPKGFIHSQFRGGIYCVLSPEETPPDFLRPKLISEGPEFDLAFW